MRVGSPSFRLFDADAHLCFDITTTRPRVALKPLEQQLLAYTSSIFKNPRCLGCSGEELRQQSITEQTHMRADPT